MSNGAWHDSALPLDTARPRVQTQVEVLHIDKGQTKRSAFVWFVEHGGIMLLFLCAGGLFPLALAGAQGFDGFTFVAIGFYAVLGAIVGTGLNLLAYLVIKGRTQRL